MPLRYTDTQKWKKSWFLDLPIHYKLLWNYLCDECNHAGIWEVNFKLANFLTGHEFDPEETLRTMEKQIIVLDNGRRWFLVDFIEWQYKCSIDDLNPQNRVHQSIIAILEKHNIFKLLNHNKEKKEGATKPLSCPIDGDKDKDKDKDKQKEGGYRGEKKRQPESQEEVAAYFQQLNIQQPEVYAEKFWNFYNTNGWVQGKGRKPIKDWRSCAKTWELPRNGDPGEKREIIKIIRRNGKTEYDQIKISEIDKLKKSGKIKQMEDQLVMDQRNKASPSRDSPSKIQGKIKTSLNA